MYPNPQDVLPLPPRPDLEQYKKQAKDLVEACRASSARCDSRVGRALATIMPSQIDSLRAHTPLTRRELRVDRCAVRHRPRPRLRELAEVRRPSRRSGPRGVARSRIFEAAAEAIVAGDIGDARGGCFATTGADSRALHARASRDAAALRGGQRRRELPAEDARERRRDRRDPARGRRRGGRRSRDVRRRMHHAGPRRDQHPSRSAPACRTRSCRS